MIKRTRTLPAHYYFDPSIYERERRNLFGREWLYAAHVSELKAAGDYLTATIAGYPILLLKDEDGAIRAHHNVCRHRASQMLSGSGGHLDSQRLVCRYHGWSYCFDGSLHSAPYFDDLTAEERSQLCLFAIRTALYRGLIFINFAPDAPAFEACRASLLDTLESSRYPFENYQIHSKVLREGDFNWKAWVDGYQECYHCPTVHPVFQKDFDLRQYVVENRDLFALHSCTRKDRSASGNFSGLWLWIYPNLGMPCYEPCFYTLQVNPLNPRRTQLTYTFHIYPGLSDRQIADFLSFVEQITDEDITMCEGVQRNLESGVFDSGLLNEKRENGVVYFHSLVRAAVEDERMCTPSPSLKEREMAPSS